MREHMWEWEWYNIRFESNSINRSQIWKLLK